ncbi:hypothetical protein IKE86_00310 [Candidatus Saccharibacteria bacterium]|nr:hypothetical protein [Candidatus Saccharibacteria bacterium]
MNGFAILMFIFGGCTFFVGLYMATGHRIGIFEERPGFKGLSIDGWKKAGRGTMIASGIIFVVGVLVWGLGV